ncbi:hypothetical protein SY88_01920 [Clostridiales bacterium PH28_bin88]|nr:hypothetical protein SY88_01920 [Clostridiales bacterium PH28_bin88]
MKPEVGQLVCSKAGRDKDRPYLVVKTIDDFFVYVVDGDIRRLDRPKRKNVKHLHVTKKVAPEIASRLNAGEAVTNAEIRQAISRLWAEQEE